MEITDLKKSTIVCIIVIIVLSAVIFLGVALGLKNSSYPDYKIQKPVGNDVHIYDAAGILGDIAESTNRFLKIIKKDYAIEAVIVTIELALNGIISGLGIIEVTVAVTVNGHQAIRHPVTIRVSIKEQLKTELGKGLEIDWEIDISLVGQLVMEIQGISR